MKPKNLITACFFIFFAVNLTHARWLQVDPKAESYYPTSPYAYCANNPVKFVDPNGEDLYLYYYTHNNTRGNKADPQADAMFMAAALTRAIDLLTNGTLKDGDAVILRSISDLGKLESTITTDIETYSPQYGQTAEFGLWSHGGIDGPIGTTLSSGEYAQGYQLSIAGWGNIDFNWKSDGAKALFYGCRTASSENGTVVPWAQKISQNANMANTDVYGQTVKSWPSTEIYRVITPANNGTYPTYMVGGATGRGGIRGLWRRLGKPYPSYPMAKYRNGGRK